jgi:hypothetical protein
MSNRPRLWRFVSFCLLGALLLSCQSGCLAYHNPAPALSVADHNCCQALASTDREHVHAFFINGLDPCHKGNLVGLADRVRELGFDHVTYGEMYDEPAMRREIVQVHEQDPRATIVLVGFSFGANLVRVLTDQLQSEDISVSLLVYLGGDTLTNSPEDRPANAQRIVNITAKGCPWLFAGKIWHGEEIDGAENIHLEDVDHFHVPTNERVLQVLRDDLIQVVAGPPAGSVSPETGHDSSKSQP